MSYRVISLVLIAPALLLSMTDFAAAQLAAVPKETQEQRDARMQWWKEARFGMFIHWGLYAIPAGEWNGVSQGGVGEWIMERARVPVAEYEKLATQFNPVKFDAKKWVHIAKNAGMKYIVITSKHHDGFCLWDSKVSGYDIMSTPFKRDILKELAAECGKQGVVLCFYHSIMDWHHPDAQALHFPTYNTREKQNPNFKRYVDMYLKPQIKELLTSYGRIGVMWFDGEWIPEWTEEMGKELEAYCRSIQPAVIVNNRVGKGRQGMQGMSRTPDAAGDFGTPEQEIPPTGFPGIDWESCMTMNDSWGFKRDDHNWKSAQTMIRMLIDTASKGGNLLMNVGPTAEGEIPAPSAERLVEVGSWMRINGQAIYGTSASPFEKLPWGRATRNGRTIYLHVYSDQWPKDGWLEVPLAAAPGKVYPLAARGQLLESSGAGGMVRIRVPDRPPTAHASVVAMELSAEPPAVPMPGVPAHNRLNQN